MALTYEELKKIYEQNPQLMAEGVENQRNIQEIEREKAKAEYLKKNPLAAKAQEFEGQTSYEDNLKSIGISPEKIKKLLDEGIPYERIKKNIFEIKKNQLKQTYPDQIDKIDEFLSNEISPFKIETAFKNEAIEKNKTYLQKTKEKWADYEANKEFLSAKLEKIKQDPDEHIWPEGIDPTAPLGDKVKKLRDFRINKLIKDYPEQAEKINSLVAKGYSPIRIGEGLKRWKGQEGKITLSKLVADMPNKPDWYYLPLKIDVNILKKVQGIKGLGLDKIDYAELKKEADKAKESSRAGEIITDVTSYKNIQDIVKGLPLGGLIMGGATKLAGVEADDYLFTPEELERLKDTAPRYAFGNEVLGLMQMLGQFGGIGAGTTKAIGMTKAGQKFLQTAKTGEKFLPRAGTHVAKSIFDFNLQNLTSFEPGDVDEKFANTVKAKIEAIPRVSRDAVIFGIAGSGKSLIAGFGGAFAAGAVTNYAETGNLKEAIESGTLLMAVHGLMFGKELTVRKWGKDNKLKDATIEGFISGAKEIIEGKKTEKEALDVKLSEEEVNNFKKTATETTKKTEPSEPVKTEIPKEIPGFSLGDEVMIKNAPKLGKMKVIEVGKKGVLLEREDGKQLKFQEKWLKKIPRTEVKKETPVPSKVKPPEASGDFQVNDIVTIPDQPERGEFTVIKSTKAYNIVKDKDGKTVSFSKDKKFQKVTSVETKISPPDIEAAKDIDTDTLPINSLSKEDFETSIFVKIKKSQELLPEARLGTDYVIQIRNPNGVEHWRTITETRLKELYPKQYEEYQKQGKLAPKEEPKIKPSEETKEVKKQLWEMTRAEVQLSPYHQKGDSAKHKIAVQEALAEGKSVPSEVLKDYPELVKKKQPAAIDEKKLISVWEEHGTSGFDEFKSKLQAVFGNDIIVEKLEYDKGNPQHWYVIGIKENADSNYNLLPRKGYEFTDNIKKYFDTSEISRTAKITNLKSVATGLKLDEIQKGNISSQEEVKKKIPVPKKEFQTGNKSRIKTDKLGDIDTKFALAEKDDLITSHDTSLNKNPEFPEKLQNRIREKVSSILQINNIINKLKPEWLGDSAKVSEGAPIIGDDGVVESGNGRVIALKKGYKENHSNMGEYKEWLKNNAEKFGFTKKQIEKFKEPILVRVRKTIIDREKFVEETNTATITEMSPIEKARIDVGKLDEKLLGLFFSESGEINTAKNRSFIGEFIQKVIPEAERGAYIDNEGRITQLGIKRIQNALFYKAYEDIGTLEKLAESTDVNIKNIINTLIDIAPKVIKLKDAIKSGYRYDFDISKEIVEAANKLSSLKYQDKKINEYLNQIDMFGDISPMAKGILGILDRYNKSSKQLNEFFSNYFSRVNRFGDPKQKSIFEKQSIPTKAELLKDLLRTEKIQDIETNLLGKKNKKGEKNDEEIDFLISQFDKVKEKKGDRDTGVTLDFMGGQKAWKIISDVIKKMKSDEQRTSGGTLKGQLWWGEEVGNLPAELNWKMREIQSQIQAGERAINLYGNMLDKKIQKFDKDKRNKLVSLLNKYLKGEGTPPPAEFKNIIDTMRDKLDDFSQTLVGLGIPTEKMQITIVNNQGKWVVRSYWKFQGEGWKPKQEVMNRAHAFFARQLKDYYLTEYSRYLLKYNKGPAKKIFKRNTAAIEKYLKTETSTADKEAILESLPAKIKPRVEKLKAIKDGMEAAFHISFKPSAGDLIAKDTFDYGKLAENTAKNLLEKDIDMKYIPARLAKRYGINQNSLKWRKNLPPEVRDLYGEINDPVINFKVSATRTLKMIKNHELLTWMKDYNLKLKEDDPKRFAVQERIGKFTERISAEDNPAWAPLDGWYVTKDLMNELKPTLTILNETWSLNLPVLRLFDLNPINWYKKSVNIARASKAVLNPAATLPFGRDMRSNFWNALGAGDALSGTFWKEFGKVIDTVYYDRIREAKSGLPGKYTYYVEKGVIGEGMELVSEIELPQELAKKFREAKNLNAESWTAIMADYILNKPGEAWNKAVEAGSILKAANDQVFKIASYENQLRQGKSEKEALKFVYDHYTYYGQTPRIVRHFLKYFPYAADFVSYPAEQLRIQTVLVKEVVRGFRNGDIKPLLRWTAASFPMIANVVFKGALIGYVYSKIEDDNERRKAIDKATINTTEAQIIRTLMPAYEKYSNLWFWKSEKGEIKYYDMGWEYPWKDLNDMITALTVGQKRNEPLSGISAAIESIWENRFKSNMAFEILYELATNEDMQTKQPLYNKEQDFFEWEVHKPTWNRPFPVSVGPKGGDIIENIYKQMGPPLAGGYNYEAIVRSFKGLPNTYGIKQGQIEALAATVWPGGRGKTFMPKAAFSQAIGQSYSIIQEQRKMLKESKKKVITGRDDIDELNTDLAQLKKNYERWGKETVEYVTAADALGVEFIDMRDILMDAGWSKKDAGYIIRNKMYREFKKLDIKEKNYDFLEDVKQIEIKIDDWKATQVPAKTKTK